MNKEEPMQDITIPGSFKFLEIKISHDVFVILDGKKDPRRGNK